MEVELPELPILAPADDEYKTGGTKNPLFKGKGGGGGAEKALEEAGSVARPGIAGCLGSINSSECRANFLRS